MGADRRPERVRVQAPAKVNLCLNVIGRRADGYHLLDGLVAFAGIGDGIETAPAARLGLEIAGPFAGALAGEPDNLVCRAARGLAALAGRAPAVRIRLEKNLPVAAGIGGGSADAAATLRALRALWGLEVGGADLDRLALSLGSDVPACLLGRPAFMSGIGEVLSAAPPLPETHLVLANPGAALSSAAVFARRAGPFARPAPRLGAAPRDAAALADWLRRSGNGLTEAACALEPRIAGMLERMAAAPDCLLARMSGSGPTCFGLFASAGAARRAAGRLAAENAGWWVRAAPVLAEPPALERRAG